jgi:hypothetical protein
MKRRAKTDRSGPAEPNPRDAHLIAHFVQLIDYHTKYRRAPRFDAFADHLNHVEQFEEDAVQLKTRLEHTEARRRGRSIEADIKHAAKHRDREINRLVASFRKHGDLARRFDLVLSIPTIGERTVLRAKYRDRPRPQGQGWPGPLRCRQHRLGRLQPIRASRPRVEFSRTDRASGEAYTELATLMVAGNPQLHTHVAIPNVVLTKDGRVSGLDLQRLAGRVHAQDSPHSDRAESLGEHRLFGEHGGEAFDQREQPLRWHGGDQVVEHAALAK